MMKQIVFIRVILIYLILLGADLRAGQPISSPEGTATSFVEEKGPLVYAPRAARAQKVVFDTADKQLIYAPDTPFRRFFESRAVDFEPYQQDYAKTTILGDIIAILRNKTYIRDIIAQVVENHKQTAISDQCPAQRSLAVAASLSKMLAAPQNFTNFTTEARAKIEVINSLVRVGNSNPLGTDKTMLQKLGDEIQEANQSITKLGTNQITSESVKDIDFTKIAGEINKIITNAVTVDQVQQACSNSEKWRDNHAELLTDYLYLEFQNENYPDMDDDEIVEAINKRFDNKESVAAYAIAALGSEATKALKIELGQRLKQRDWLRKVLDRAIAKRADLFKKSGSPVQNLRDTQDQFKKFVETRLITAALTEGLKSDSTSLWQAFLTHLNSDPKYATNRYLLQAANNRERAMEKDELRNFGKSLRLELQTNGKTSAGAFDMAQIKKALDAYFMISDNAALLCPEFGMGKTISALETSDRGIWAEQLTNDLAVNDAFLALSNALISTNANRGAEVDLGSSKFLSVVQISMGAINQKKAPDDRIEVALLLHSVTNRIQVYLKPFKDSATKANPLKLGELMVDALLDKPPLSTARARHRLISDFEVVFNQMMPLIFSDDPILKAFLGSDQVKYSVPEFRKQALALVPTRFTALAGNSTNLISNFTTILNDPEISFLFGQGSGNPQVIEAFKQEFCSVFQDRQKLNDAVAAERESDYDYWWFTFYPKAIPFGSKRLQGASIIEIGFPESIIPEVQYHRWLQDTSLEDRPAKRANAESGNYFARDRRTGPAPGEGQDSELIQDIRLRNATTLLRDMLNVLESSDLKSQFSSVRPMMLKVLEEFTNPRFSEEERYRHGVRALYEEVFFEENNEWLKSLASIVDKNGLKNGVLNQRLGLAAPLDLNRICVETNELAKILDSLALQIPVQWKHEDWFGLPSALSVRRDELGIGEGNVVYDKALQLSRHFLDSQFDELMLDTKREIRTQFSEMEIESGGKWGNFGKSAENLEQRWSDILIRAKQDARLLLSQEFYKVKTNANLTCIEEISRSLFSAAINRFVSAPLVCTDDLKNLSELSRQILDNQSRADLHTSIWRKLVLCAPRSHQLPTAADFACALNKLIEGDSLAKEPWAKRLSQSGELKAVIAYSSTPEDIRRLNRLLLDAALAANLEPDGNLEARLNRSIATELSVATFAKAPASVLQEQRDELVRHVNGRLVACLTNSCQSAATNLFLAKMKAGNRPESKYEKEIKAQVQSFAIDFYLRQTSDPRVRDDLRHKLRDLDFDKLHVLFSVYAVTETKARLPEKVNLFLWAQARGVMLFQHKIREFQTNQMLQEHAMNYWLTAEPIRGDRETEFCKIPTNAITAMQAEANLYGLILNSYFSSYPEVPSKKSIQEGYFENNHDRLIPVVYDWLDYSGVLYNPNAPSLLNRFVEDSTFLTRKARGLLSDCLKSSASLPLDYRSKLSNAVHQCFFETNYVPLVKELDETLFDNHYRTLLQMLSMIEETERHAVPYPQIHHGDYSTFRSWGRPTFQKGIQIVEMLPESRDDLVSMSINEGGVVAKIAGQAEGSAAYDMNELKMASRVASSSASQLQKMLSSRQDATNSGLGTLQEQLGQNSSSGSQQIFKDLSQLGKSAGSQGYSLGATANGSVYARARAALAYSRRREYLDAAITSAGRGDNFAKWVVRTSDIRSELAAGSGKKNVAAAHNGFPNGDQPFHLLVKVPRRATHSDWDGRNYVLFNSTYVATSRISVWKTTGFAGLIAKAPFALFNPNWWTQIEEGLVGTQYPFMWNVRTESEQKQLLRTPNLLGGTIWLDDTDKIKYSDILEKIDAEDNFIRMTREAQTSDLNTVMNDVKKESGEFEAQVRKGMADRMQASEKAISDAQNSTSLSNRIHQLEANVNNLRSSLKPTSTNTPSATGN